MPRKHHKTEEIVAKLRQGRCADMGQVGCYSPRALVRRISIDSRPFYIFRASRPPEADATGPARAAIPRERFCALARDGKVVVAPEVAISAATPKGAVTFDLAAINGASALLAEACP